MATQERLQQQVVETVTRFQNDQMSVTPELVSVDFHPRCVVVTLQGATCPAEKNYARDRQGRELLGRFYNELFNATKPILEASITEILGRTVQQSSLSIDPESGNGVILFTFICGSPQEESSGVGRQEKGGARCRKAT